MYHFHGTQKWWNIVFHLSQLVIDIHVQSRSFIYPALHSYYLWPTPAYTDNVKVLEWDDTQRVYKVENSSEG